MKVESETPKTERLTMKPISRFTEADFILSGTVPRAERPFTLEINGITMTIPKEVLEKAVIDYLQKNN